MALFRRKRRYSPSASALYAVQAGHEPWLDHGLADGETVTCGRCAGQLGVRLVSPSSVTVSHDGALDGIALICTACGRLLCRDCALAASDNPYMPKCDHCRAGVTVPMSR
ncbi:hypothetical protein [Streptomyces sp. enrichment culture]|uniref:hypothetical protein n=1 Tax=Streptomyces sp. enrichment culture TaxID=1795815 RepID=UPI003F56F627